MPPERGKSLFLDLLYRLLVIHTQISRLVNDKASEGMCEPSLPSDKTCERQGIDQIRALGYLKL